MKRSNLTTKKIAVIATVIVFIAALVYVSFFSVDIEETVVEQPINIQNQ